MLLPKIYETQDNGAIMTADKNLIYSVEEAIRAVETLREEPSLLFIESFASKLAETFESGGKIILAGNGGSLCDASHFAEELTGYFREKRKALPAIVLSEPGHITCCANDTSFEEVFSRGIEAHGRPGDIFCGLTTSGNSANIITAFERAKELGLFTVLFLGKTGGKLKGKADLELVVGGFNTSDRIQEAHMAAIHIVIERMEARLFAEVR